MNCSEVLRKVGRAYPRTCAICGFGPCVGTELLQEVPPKPKPIAMYKPALTPEQVAERILHAAGSGLRHYVPESKKRIIFAATDIIKELTDE